MAARLTNPRIRLRRRTLDRSGRCLIISRAPAGNVRASLNWAAGTRAHVWRGHTGSDRQVGRRTAAACHADADATSSRSDSSSLCRMGTLL